MIHGGIQGWGMRHALRAIPMIEWIGLSGTYEGFFWYPGPALPIRIFRVNQVTREEPVTLDEEKAAVPIGSSCSASAFSLEKCFWFPRMRECESFCLGRY